MKPTEFDAHVTLERQHDQRMTQMVASLVAFASRGIKGYEAAKRQYDALFPNATPAERDETMRKIAKRCGV